MFSFHFSGTVSAFCFLSHLIRIVFPLIVFTYTVMSFSWDSSSRTGSVVFSPLICGKREDVVVELEVFFIRTDELPGPATYRNKMISVELSGPGCFNTIKQKGSEDSSLRKIHDESWSSLQHCCTASSFPPSLRCRICFYREKR